MGRASGRRDLLTARHCSPDAARPLRSAAPQEARRQVKGGARTFGPYRGARLLPQEARGRPPPWSLAEPTERPAAREALDQVRARCSQGDRSTCRSLFCPPCSPRLPSTPRLMCALLTGRYALTSLRNPFLNRKGRMQQTQGMKWTTACQTVLSPDRREESLPQRDAPACVPGGACPRQGRLRTGSSDGSLFGSCRSSSAGDLKGFSASAAPRPRRAVSASSRTSGVRIF